MATRLGAPRSAAAPDQSDMAEAATRADLAIAMQLLRASNMKWVGLQLALVSNNRKAALVAIDGLIDLDSEIASFIADVPPNRCRAGRGWARWPIGPACRTRGGCAARRPPTGRRRTGRRSRARTRSRYWRFRWSRAAAPAPRRTGICKRRARP